MVLSWASIDTFFSGWLPDFLVQFPYYVQEKGKASTDTNSFFVDISNPPTGESFYRELLTAMDVPQSQIEEKLRDMMTRFTGASNFVNKEDNNKNTSVSDEKESGYLNK